MEQAIEYHAPRRVKVVDLKLASLVCEGRGVRGEGRGMVVAAATVDLIGPKEEESTPNTRLQIGQLPTTSAMGAGGCERAGESSPQSQLLAAWPGSCPYGTPLNRETKIGHGI